MAEVPTENVVYPRDRLPENVGDLRSIFEFHLHDSVPDRLTVWRKTTIVFAVRTFDARLDFVEQLLVVELE